MKRHDLALLNWLKENTGLLFTASAAAETFDVSERTIYRSLKRIRETHKLDGERGIGYIFRGEK